MSKTYKKMFNLLMEFTLFTELNKRAAMLQMETGSRVSVTRLINQVLTDYVKERKE